jgi:hypothetical protein
MGLSVTRFEELTLAANLLKKNLTRLKWNAETNATTVNKSGPLDWVSSSGISLQPMQIRTFLLYVEPASGSKFGSW